VVVRTILTPAIGLALIRQLLRETGGAFRKRRAAKISRAEMMRWFQWTTEQQTTQATGISQRIQGYLSKNKREAALRSKT
jgi:hypothetical protein